MSDTSNHINGLGYDTLVTSTVLQHYIARHCAGTRYKLQFVLFHRTDVQRGYVATAILARLQMRTVRPISPGTYMYTHLI
jgi:hypothetical protein